MYCPVGKGRICEGKKFSHPLPPINKIAGFFQLSFFHIWCFILYSIFMTTCHQSIKLFGGGYFKQKMLY